MGDTPTLPFPFPDPLRLRYYPPPRPGAFAPTTQFGSDGVQWSAERLWRSRAIISSEAILSIAEYRVNGERLRVLDADTSACNVGAAMVELYLPMRQYPDVEQAYLQSHAVLREFL